MVERAPALLSSVLSSSATDEEKANALNELWESRSPEIVQAIKVLAGRIAPLDGLTMGLYTLARELPIEVLMRCAHRFVAHRIMERFAQ